VVLQRETLAGPDPDASLPVSMFGRPGDEALRIEPLEVLVVGGRFGQSFPPDETAVESVGDELPYGIEQRDGSPVGVDQKIACAKILSGAAPDPSDPSDELPVRGEQQERGVASVEYEQGVPAGFQQFGVGQQARFGGLQRRDLHAPEQVVETHWRLLPGEGKQRVVRRRAARAGEPDRQRTDRRGDPVYPFVHRTLRVCSGQR